MMVRFLAIWFALSALGTIAHPVGVDTADDLVQTPGGLIPKSNTHLVPEGAKIIHTPTLVQLVRADGTVLHSTPVATSGQVSPLRNISGTPTSAARRALHSGWTAYSFWSPSSGPEISYFETTWTVPPAPTLWSGQLVYIFNGLEPSTTLAILQPVLQYGYSEAGGGIYWSIASWYVIGTTAYYTSAIEVQPGQTLRGVLDNSGTTTSGGILSSYMWYSYFEIDNVLNSNTLLILNTVDILHWACETLEIYTTTTASNLPAGTLAMSGIEIYTGNSQPSALNWLLTNDAADSIYIELVSTSSSNGELEIVFPIA
ncbi:hypothetical protein GALMADRAFT_138052 [Galerina marginata CBS 339.88]|uniref:Uncharacterized protein n=1 Tax=Galerina marginata (strain CBS 339.88) TaxID=685588 RepID=A0A067T439_GALM3|nr:hypothetical protein GALMADRAFT_138052 [Galerina marginata CBS 339.88]